MIYKFQSIAIMQIKNSADYYNINPRSIYSFNDMSVLSPCNAYIRTNYHIEGLICLVLVKL